MKSPNHKSYIVFLFEHIVALKSIYGSSNFSHRYFKNTPSKMTNDKLV